MPRETDVRNRSARRMYAHTFTKGPIKLSRRLVALAPYCQERYSPARGKLPERGARSPRGSTQTRSKRRRFFIVEILIAIQPVPWLVEATRSFALQMSPSKGPRHARFASLRLTSRERGGIGPNENSVANFPAILAKSICTYPCSVETTGSRAKWGGGCSFERGSVAGIRT